MELDQPAEQLAEREREPVVERLIVEPHFAGDARHDDVAAHRHAVDDAQTDRVLRLPQVVARETGQDERGGECREDRGRRRQG